jgi:hypothetical protein
MPQYRSYGQLDTQILPEGDGYFQRMNTRLRPDTLEEGVVAYSQNGRMNQDGAWGVRRGIIYRAGAPEQTSEGLTLPFTLYADKVISSATRSLETVTVTTSTSHGFVTGTQVGIYDISGTVDPTGNRTITSTGATTFTFTIPGAAGSETYSLGSSPKAGAGSLSDVIGKVRGSCLFRPQQSSQDSYIICVFANKAVAYKYKSWNTSTDIEYPSGVSITKDVEIKQYFDKVTIFIDGETALEWDGDLSGSPAFTKVANGDYTQPEVFTAANNAVASGGVVTITATAHDLPVGAAVKVFDAGSTSLAEDSFYTVASVPTANTFTFYADVDDFSATSVVVGKAQSQGLGFSHMPAPAWGVYHQRRLIVPFKYTTTGTSGSEVITDRGIGDEILISDILDSDTYDVLQSSFRINSGSSDYIQTVHPFSDNQAIVFCRNSIHLLSGLSGSLSDISVSEITREAGLLARRSVQTIGNKIYFLSDNGVYAVTFEDLYNLRGSELPLSAPIQPTVDGLNATQNAIAVYAQNRYWLACSTDSSGLNNQVLVYNVINEGWESVDTFDGPGFDIQNIVVDNGDIVYVTTEGGIHEEGDGFYGVDLIVPAGGTTRQIYSIDGELITRGYDLNRRGRITFKEMEMELEALGSTRFDVSYIARNIDSEGALFATEDKVGTLNTGDDAVVNDRMGNVRADSVQLKFESTQGSGIIRAASVSGTPAITSLTSVS